MTDEDINLHLIHIQYQRSSCNLTILISNNTYFFIYAWFTNYLLPEIEINDIILLPHKTHYRWSNGHMLTYLTEWNCHYMYKVYTFCLYVDNAYMYGYILLNFNADCEFRAKFFRDSNLKEKNYFLVYWKPKTHSVYIHKSKWELNWTQTY